MKKIISFFIQNELLVNMLIVLVAVMGIMSALRLNSSFFPQEEERFIIIEAVYPGASPREVEEGITLKIEDNLKGITGIDRVTSTSYENTARITVELDFGINADLVLDDVKNAIDQISNFPEGMERLVTFVRENVNFTGKIALVGDVPLRTLKERAKKLEDGLRALPNISKIELTGYTDEEIEVAVSENKLRAYGLTFEEVASAIRRENIQLTGGTIKAENEVIIRADHKEYSAARLGDVVLKTQADGQTVRLNDVADVREDWSENTSKAYFNGKRAVLVTVNTLNEENILKASDAIIDYVAKFNSENTVVEAVMVRDGTEALRERIALLGENGMVGAALVFILLGMFLRIRLAFWVALGIPISFFGMIVVAYLAGLTINVLSLFGMIVVVGILVDDGIVVGENIFQHYERGEPKLKAVVNGTLEVIPSILSAILTTCAAFSLFFFVDGRLGAFFSDIAFVVIAALMMSLVEVILFLPAHLAHVKDLSDEVKQNKVKVFVENLLIKFRDYTFRPLLDFVLANKPFAFSVALAALVITFGMVAGGRVGITFFPNIERQSVTCILELPAGTAESVTEDITRRIEQAAIDLNEQYAEKLGEDLITDVEISLGRSSNQANLVFYLISSERRRALATDSLPLSSFEIAGAIRKAVGPIPQATQLSFETGTPFGKPLNVSFSGDDYQRIRDAVANFKEELTPLEVVKDIVTNDQADQPEIEIRLNETGRGLGFSEQSIIAQIRNGFFGLEAQRLQRGDDEVKVWVRYQMEDRNELEELLNMRVKSPTGASVPVREIAEITHTKGLLAINHLDGKRQISLQAEMASFEITSGEMIEAVSTKVIPVVQQRFPDVNIQLDGQQRELAKVGASVGRAGPVILVIMGALILMTFRSISQMLALLLMIPFGYVGMVWGHYIHDQPISILSSLGLIALIGVLVNDGLVFVAAFNSYLQKGMKYNEALRETALSRFRPIFLTTLTTCAGLGPLIFETSFQAQFLIPMAITLAYGLLIGSLMLTLILPVLLATFNGIKVYVNWLWEGKKPTAESMEKAIIRQRKAHHYLELDSAAPAHRQNEADWE